MKYVLACDCGGTKCAFLLCDEQGRVAASAVGGTANSSFENPEDIAEKIRTLLVRLREESGIPAGDVVAWGGVLMLPPELLRPAVEELFPNCRRIYRYGEPETNLLASAGTAEGFLAHSGTGSFGAAILQGKLYHYGGMGSYLGDEGSGYDVGIHTFNAVKFDLVGLAPHTSLTERLCREWDADRNLPPEKLAWALAHCVVKVNSESRLRIARLTYLAAAEAEAGDAVAQGILREAGLRMFEHIRVVVETLGARPEGVLTVSGGTWNCGRSMTEPFLHACAEAYPGLRYVAPRLAPIGGVAACILRDALGIAPCEGIFRNLPAK